VALDPEGESLRAFAATTAVCCVGLVTYLRAVMHDHAVATFRRDLLTADFGDSSGTLAELRWEVAMASLSMEHSVPGGLSTDEQRRLFEEHVDELRPFR